MKNLLYPVIRFIHSHESILSRINLRTLILIFASVSFTGQTVLAAPAANLDQARNGSATSPVDPVAWSNGNLNASQSHYLEGYSIPYRLIMTDLPTDGTLIKLIMAYDVKESYKHALDYLTYYDRMDSPPHGAPYFPHEGAEEVKPLIGTVLDGDPSVVVNTFPIPEPPGTGDAPYAPNQPYVSWKQNETESYMTLYGGTFYGGPDPAIFYPSEAALDPTVKDAKQQIEIWFYADSPTAVLAWGGHIATRYDWGYDPDTMEPYSAGAINGSPYHMRLVDWNLGNLGNTDRSLSADAVITLPPCDILGTAEVCYDGRPFDFTLADSANSYLWEVSAAPSNSYPIDQVQIVGGQNEQSVLVDVLAPPQPDANKFLVMVTITGESGLQNTCEFLVTVHPSPECLITPHEDLGEYNVGTTYEFSAPEGMDTYFWTISGDAVIVNGVDDQQTVSIHTSMVQKGSFNLNVIITDQYGCGNECSTGARSVGDQNGPPTVICPPPYTMECDVFASLPVEQLDGDGHPLPSLTGMSHHTA